MKIDAKKQKRSPLLDVLSGLALPYSYPWKVLGTMINDLSHLLTETELKRLTVIVRSRDFEGYLALSGEWGIQCNYLKDRPLPEVRAVYQVISLLKKFQFNTDKKARLLAAKTKLVQAEKACALYNREGYKALSIGKTKRERGVFTYMRLFLRKLLGSSPPGDESMTEWSRHGPGSNLDTLDGNTSAFHKHENWPYSCTQAAFPYARYAIQCDPRWLGALEDDYRRKYFIPKHMILNQRVFWSQVFYIVPGNRISFVPKNAKTERSIAIEPSMNLYLQLGVDGFIRRALKRWGIDINDQEKNQELARLGSLLGAFSTLDLSSASDMISIKLCELVLPPDWFDYLMALRSPSGEYKGETIFYEKISSMGNGFTFALETAIFAAVVYGAQKVEEGRYNADKCAIYGDDIIVETHITSTVIESLTNCGFKLNLEKSFLQGPFRESCGADWFQGKQIRPVFLDTMPEMAQGLLNDYNRLRRTLRLRWEIGDESRTLKALFRWLPVQLHGMYGPVSDEEFDSYIHTERPLAWKNQTYKFSRLILKPVAQRFPRDGFLFGKLMDNLRVLSPSDDKWNSRYYRGVKLNASGSKFSLTNSRLVKASINISAVSDWQYEYREISPSWVSSGLLASRPPSRMGVHTPETSRRRA